MAAWRVEESGQGTHHNQLDKCGRKRKGGPGATRHVTSVRRAEKGVTQRYVCSHELFLRPEHRAMLMG